jgi:hypothetical protein
MSRSIKTRELFFQSLNSLIANDTTGSLAPIEINIPETNPVFKNVVAEIYLDDNSVSTGGNINKRALTFNLGTVTPLHLNNSGSTNNVLATSGEPISFQHSFDITSHFNSNWSGTLMGVTASFVANQTNVTTGFSNLGCRLVLTYEYDTNSTTQAKTIFVPIGSRYPALPTSKGTRLGVIPNLNTFLPENNKEINQINFILENNKNSTGTADDTLFFEIESSGSHSPYIYENGGAVARLHKYIWSNKNFSTNGEQDFFFWSTHNYHANNSILMAIDYNYTPGTSTKILNSVRIPFHFENQANIAINSSNYIRQQINYLVNEPGNIEPTSSAVMLFNTKGLAIAGSSIRTNTGSSFLSLGSQQVTNTSYFTSMVTSSNAFNLVKGRNIFYLDYHKIATTSMVGSLSGLYYLNYYSNNGDVNKHNKTIINNFLNVNASPRISSDVTTQHEIWIPESSSFFHLNSIGNEYNSIKSTASTVAITGQYNLFYSKSLNEMGEDKQNTLDSILYCSSETGNEKFYTSIDNLFKKTNADILRNLHPTQSRGVTYIVGQQFASTTIYHSCATYYTYNTISHQVSGSISNVISGDIKLDLYRDYDNRKIQTQTLSSNGNYSFLVPDNEDIYYVIATNGNTSKISNKNNPTSGSFDISLAEVDENYETFF